jgi:hypothetical protein
MRLFMFAVSAIALATSSAPAASQHHIRPDQGAYWQDSGTYHYDSGSDARPFNSGGAYAPGPIYRQGHYLGTDPDPRVRYEIARDPYFTRK